MRHYKEHRKAPDFLHAIVGVSPGYVLPTCSNYRAVAPYTIYLLLPSFLFLDARPKNISTSRTEQTEKLRILDLAYLAA